MTTIFPYIALEENNNVRVNINDAHGKCIATTPIHNYALRALYYISKDADDFMNNVLEVLQNFCKMNEWEYASVSGMTILRDAFASIRDSIDADTEHENACSMYYSPTADQINVVRLSDGETIFALTHDDLMKIRAKGFTCEKIDNYAGFLTYALTELARKNITEFSGKYYLSTPAFKSIIRSAFINTDTNKEENKNDMNNDNKKVDTTKYNVEISADTRGRMMLNIKNADVTKSFAMFENHLRTAFYTTLYDENPAHRFANVMFAVMRDKLKKADKHGTFGSMEANLAFLEENVYPKVREFIEHSTDKVSAKYERVEGVNYIKVFCSDMCVWCVDFDTIVPLGSPFLTALRNVTDCFETFNRRNQGCKYYFTKDSFQTLSDAVVEALKTQPVEKHGEDETKDETKEEPKDSKPLGFMLPKKRYKELKKKYGEETIIICLADNTSAYMFFEDAVWYRDNFLSEEKIYNERIGFFESNIEENIKYCLNYNKSVLICNEAQPDRLISSARELRNYEAKDLYDIAGYIVNNADYDLDDVRGYIADMLGGLKNESLHDETSDLVRDWCAENNVDDSSAFANINLSDVEKVVITEMLSKGHYTISAE